MQQWNHKRRKVSFLLAMVMILTVVITPARILAATNLAEDEVLGTNYEDDENETSASRPDDNANDVSAEEIYSEYYDAPVGWADVNPERLLLTGSFYSLRLISVEEDMALAVISQCPECPTGNMFFATSYNMADWEIRSPAPGWHIYYDGYYYWYVDGLYRTSDWQDDWQFHSSPPENYEGNFYEWAFMMAHIFDNFESIHEVQFMSNSNGEILRIERLPYIINNEVTWVGFVVTEDDNGNIRRQQIRLFAQGQLLNPLAEDAAPTLIGLEGIGWAREAVEFIAARDLMDMYACPESDELIVFNPTGRATRGDVLAAAVKALGLTAPITFSREHIPFEDVSLDGRGLYIDIAKQLGFVAGVGNNQFAPDRTISRQDMMTMLYNILLALGQIEPDFGLTSLGRFRDIGQIADYARLPIASLAKAGIIAGDGVNINPRGYMTRVEAAVFVWNLYRMGSE